MSPTDTRWQALRKEIDDRRTSPHREVTTLKNQVIQRLKKLGERNLCTPNAIGWIQVQKGNGPVRIDFKHSADGRDSWEHPAVCLRGLKHLRDGAVLTFSIAVDDRLAKILSYSVSLEGSLRIPLDGKGLWHSRIDLTKEPEGRGLCGHPLMHCHIGSNAKPKDTFSPRAPLPWLHPADALDWLLATVEPSLEP